VRERSQVERKRGDNKLVQTTSHGCKTPGDKLKKDGLRGSEESRDELDSLYHPEERGNHS